MIICRLFDDKLQINKSTISIQYLLLWHCHIRNNFFFLIFWLYKLEVKFCVLGVSQEQNALLWNFKLEVVVKVSFSFFISVFLVSKQNLTKRGKNTQISPKEKKSFQSFDCINYKWSFVLWVIIGTKSITLGFQTSSSSGKSFLFFCSLFSL